MSFRRANDRVVPSAAGIALQLAGEVMPGRNFRSIKLAPIVDGRSTTALPSASGHPQ
jgi:hypothetical protein